MAKTSSYIKCNKCGVFNTNRDHCKNCGELISFQKKEELRAEKIHQELIKEELTKLENPNFVTRLKRHPFFLTRFLGWILYSVWFVISAIGAGLAWFVAMVAAG